MGFFTPHDEENYEELSKTKPRRKALRPEAILGILAGLSAMLLIIIVILSFPYFGKSPAEEDPEALLRPYYHMQENLQAEIPLEEVPDPEATIPPEANPYTKYDFQYNKQNYLLCTAQNSYPGVDVSAYQEDIDWEQVAASGIRFAMVRLGFRGYGQAGNMVVDPYAKANLEGARAAGLAVGAYFFSQATSIAEVDEEIALLKSILGGFELDMPLVLDWEIASETGRTQNVDRRTLTDCLLHFCRTMSEQGFTPMTYFNWGQARNMIYLNELEEYPFWLALYQTRMTFPYRVEMWQYTCTGRVPGIQGDVDINIYMPDYR